MADIGTEVAQGRERASEAHGAAQPDIASDAARVATATGAARADAARRRARDRQLAKVGLTAVLGVLTVTGFVRSRGARRLHLAAGAALLGLSLWHHTLYQRSGDSGGRSGGDSGGSRESGGPR